jgi:hypothetical protein
LPPAGSTMRLLPTIASEIAGDPKANLVLIFTRIDWGRRGGALQISGDTRLRNIRPANAALPARTLQLSIRYPGWWYPLLIPQNRPRAAAGSGADCVRATIRVVAMTTEPTRFVNERRISVLSALRRPGGIGPSQGSSPAGQQVARCQPADGKDPACKA